MREIRLIFLFIKYSHQFWLRRLALGSRIDYMGIQVRENGRHFQECPEETLNVILCL